MTFELQARLNKKGLNLAASRVVHKASESVSMLDLGSQVRFVLSLVAVSTTRKIFVMSESRVQDSWQYHHMKCSQSCTHMRVANHSNFSDLLRGKRNPLASRFTGITVTQQTRLCNLGQSIPSSLP